MRYARSPKLSSRRGIALVMALVALAVLFVIMAVVAWQGIAGRRLLERREEQLQCRYLAEAGLELAAARLLTNPAGYKGESVQVIPRSQVHIEVQAIGQAADWFEVSSEAYFPTDAPRPTVRMLTRRFHPTLDKNRKRLEVLPAL